MSEGSGYGATEGHKAFRADEVDTSGPGREVSDEEQEGFEATDVEPQDPTGVGAGRATEYGREDERTDLGTQGPSERPVGGSTPEQHTGVDAQETAEDDMPNMPAGDQGG
jgi:hypothetical protein